MVIGCVLPLIRMKRNNSCITLFVCVLKQFKGRDEALSSNLSRLVIVDGSTTEKKICLRILNFGTRFVDRHLRKICVIFAGLLRICNFRGPFCDDIIEIRLYAFANVACFTNSLGSLVNQCTIVHKCYRTSRENT